MIRALAIAALLAACGGDAGPDAGPEPEDPCHLVDCSVHSQYVADTQQLTPTALLDIDGDGDPENHFGTLLVTNTDARVDLPGNIQRGVLRGETITLLNLRAADLSTSSGAAFTVFLGTNPNPAPCASEADTACGRHLDGAGSFDIALDSPNDATLPGAIVGGRLRAGPAQLELRLWFGAGDPISIPLIGARIDADVTDSSITGELGGGIYKDHLDEQVVPAIIAYIEAAVARDCTGAAPTCCTPDTPGEAWMESLDFDGDCTLDTDVVTGLEAANILDLDLLDDEGFHPNSDGIKDSLSFGIEFTGVSAAFDAPP